ncbi:DUF421 domain-containing protein [Tissierella carlieri]|jgi:uncharacterized membrane protein YcaP (DUF421 family)|uniref:DUF421 domain-containing protein n=1 Tax=Tissierella carlieri TaxID=689904 RepID=UPI003866CC21
MDIKKIFFEGEKLRVLELFIRTSILYFTLFASAKLMKFCQFSIVTPYNFLMAAVTSNIAASRIVNPKSRPIDAILIIVLYSLIHLSISYLYLKAPSIVTQKPIILIKNGKIIKENLFKSNLTIDNLFSILREKDVYDIESVEYLLAEAIGSFSIAINNNNLPPKKLDIGIETSKDILSEVIIYKGRVDEKVLSKNKLGYKWMEDQLKLMNIDNIDNIYLGILTPAKKLYVNL